MEHDNYKFNPQVPHQFKIIVCQAGASYKEFVKKIEEYHSLGWCSEGPLYFGLGVDGKTETRQLVIRPMKPEEIDRIKEYSGNNPEDYWDGSE